MAIQESLQRAGKCCTEEEARKILLNTVRLPHPISRMEWFVVTQATLRRRQEFGWNSAQLKIKGPSKE